MEIEEERTSLIDLMESSHTSVIDLSKSSHTTFGISHVTHHGRTIQVDASMLGDIDMAKILTFFELTEFGGPFQIKAGSLRNFPYQKSYVCIFVCLSTKLMA